MLEWLVRRICDGMVLCIWGCAIGVLLVALGGPPWLILPPAVIGCALVILGAPLAAILEYRKRRGR